MPDRPIPPGAAIGGSGGMGSVLAWLSASTVVLDRGGPAAP